jgi:hypothetical protein
MGLLLPHKMHPAAQHGLITRPAETMEKTAVLAAEGVIIAKHSQF